MSTWRSDWPSASPAMDNSSDKKADAGGAMMPPSFYSGSFSQMEGAGSAWSEPVMSKYTLSTQAPPLVAPNEFQDASTAEAWQPKEHVVYDARKEPKEPIKRANTTGPRRTPQRHIRVRSAGSNLEARPSFHLVPFSHSSLVNSDPPLIGVADELACFSRSFWPVPSFAHVP